jgi:NAD(P)-dependent dehydrogenase (short-subunit alcohol dehydrogenase family)
MKRIFITGSNRGIGLELARQCLQRGDLVFASCRQPDQADELQALKAEYPDRLTILQLDITNQAQVEAVAEPLATEVDGLDILFNNAGVSLGGERIGNLEVDSVLNVLYVNSVGPLMVTQSLLDLLRAGQNPKIINVTSQLGSITRKRSGGRYSYDGRKAALNMFTRTLAFEVLPDGIITIVMHPGWVQTDMGGSGAPLSVKESAQGILQVTENLTKDDAGRFLQWDGDELPW